MEPANNIYEVPSTNAISFVQDKKETNTMESIKKQLNFNESVLDNHVSRNSSNEEEDFVETLFQNENYSSESGKESQKKTGGLKSESSFTNEDNLKEVIQEFSSLSSSSMEQTNENKSKKRKKKASLLDCSFSTHSEDSNFSRSSKRVNEHVLLQDGIFKKRLNAVQLSDDDIRAPLLPPDVIKVGHHTEYYSEIADAFKQYRQMMIDDVKNNRRRRKYLQDSFHVKFFGFHNVNVIDYNQTKDIEIAITLHDNSITYIKVTKAPDILTKKILRLHKRLTKESKGNCRTNDRGTMFALGKKSQHTEYAICTQNADVRQLVADVGRCRKQWFKKKFPEEFEFMFDDAPNLSYCRDSLSDFMVHSIGLGNASHYDTNDVSITTSTWVEETEHNTQNWYLVFPNVTFDDERATLIKLFHGCTVSWDAYKLRHASSLPTYKFRGKFGTSGGNCELRRKQT